VIGVDCNKQKFYDATAGVTDPESESEKHWEMHFIEVFDEESINLEGV